MFNKTIAVMLFAASMPVAAWDGEHGYHHHGHHHRHYREAYPSYYAPPVERVYYREEIRYVPAPIVRYEPLPPPPPVYYYDRYYPQRSPAGMLGGALGGAVGYELGNGEPFAAGIGAAAGALFGNSMR